MENTHNRFSEKELAELVKHVEDIEANESSPTSILKNFNADKWADWLDDIVNYGFAYPINQVSRDGDVIVDMVDYLRQHSISIFPYEEALSIIINQFDFQYSNPYFLERLLNAIINIRERKTSNALIKILTSRENNHIRGKYNFIKSLALLGLAKSSQLDETQIKTIYGYLKMNGLHEMVHDPTFFGNSLRFFYRKISLENFFYNLESIFVILGSDKLLVSSENNLIKRYITIFIDKLEEVHYFKIGNFYSVFCKSFLKMASSEHNCLNENTIYNDVMSRFATVMDKKPYVNETILRLEQEFDADHNHLFQENNYGFCLKVLLNFFQKKLELSYTDILHCVAFLLGQDIQKYRPQIEIFFQRYSWFLRTNYYTLPNMAFEELNNFYSYNIVTAVEEIGYDAVYSSCIEPTEDDLEELQDKHKTFFYSFKETA